MPPKSVSNGGSRMGTFLCLRGLRSTPRVRSDCPRGESPGVKTKTDWLDWQYHDVANATSAKLPSARVRV
jgi:hypothetical protein